MDQQIIVAVTITLIVFIGKSKSQTVKGAQTGGNNIKPFIAIRHL